MDDNKHKSRSDNGLQIARSGRRRKSLGERTVPVTVSIPGDTLAASMKRAENADLSFSSYVADVLRRENERRQRVA